MKKITVFCGSNSGRNQKFRDNAFDLGVFLAESGIELVFGGGKTGLMGAVADGVLSANGRVTGVLPQFLKRKELEHTGLTQVITVETMHERKSVMYDMCDGIIVLPGGFGTMDELFESLTWAQLALHKKPIAILNVDGYYDHLLSFVEKMIECNFLKEEYRQLFIVDHDIKELLFKMEMFEPPINEKWFEVK